ncbi:uncharacterized protein [Palaemon carinicauda]|uniref:uncharacterized protein n=1 Tax=Palaemon carinicauda TaxID=392227 RepID=UPI0035B62F58
MCEASLNDSSVTALRDSASSQTIISAASQDNLKYTKEYIAVSDLTTTTLLPEAEVDIACPYFTGKAKVAVLDKPLPCYPIQMIIGNDLAGSSVLKPKLIVTTPEVVIKDELSKKPGKISQVITRSSSKTSNTNFPPKVKNDRITEALDLVDIKKDQFTVLQQKDSSLKALWDKVVDPTDNPKTPYFYVEKNILFRHYKSPKAPTSNSWHDCFQVVFPEPLRKPLLDLAHSTESHLGVNKTYKRLFEDFYWPEMRKDIKEFIASCHHCQITGKPNEKIPPAPLQSIPVPKSPFDKTNGALERMHQTLKSLLRKYISETSQHWDEDLDLLMYVLRCTPHDSTGVSPFELMFGRKPRTILSSVKENILQRKPEETTNIYQYLKELKKKFTYIYDIATTNLVSSQQKMQNIYNKKAKMREFKTDDQVLVYHPIPGAPLREKYAGPYKIVHRTSKVNYIISTPDRKRQTQLVHVNLLKPYITPVKKIDASNTGYGAVLLQSYSVGTTETPPPLHHLLPIAYHSRFFKGAQTRWATVEKELYAIAASLLHFQPYLEGHHRVVVYTDHRPLIFLERSRLRNNKLLRWSYILSAFNLQLQSIGGTNNLIADTLSRLPPPSTPQPSSPTIVGPS